MDGERISKKAAKDCFERGEELEDDLLKLQPCKSCNIR